MEVSFGVDIVMAERRAYGRLREAVECSDTAAAGEWAAVVSGIRAHMEGELLRAVEAGDAICAKWWLDAIRDEEVQE